MLVDSLSQIPRIKAHLLYLVKPVDLSGLFLFILNRTAIISKSKGRFWFRKIKEYAYDMLYRVPDMQKESIQVNIFFKTDDHIDSIYLCGALLHFSLKPFA